MKKIAIVALGIFISSIPFRTKPQATNTTTVAIAATTAVQVIA